MADPPPPPKQPQGNPAFRYMGLPTLRAKLPSRNWLIFLSLSGALAATIYHDRRHQRRITTHWSTRVSHLSLEPLSTLHLPRKVTVYLCAPPGSGSDIRAAQEAYRDFVKPVFVAAALDVEFVEGRRMGEVQARVAEGVRRRRRGETPQEEEERLGVGVAEVRRKGGVSVVEGVAGDVVVGRHAWKEYVQGLHEGWLGPLEAPAEPALSSPPPPVDGDMGEEEEKEKKKKEEETKPTVPSPVPPPYLSPTSYASSSLPSAPLLEPVGVIPFPYILGFLNTPIRFYRYVTRRHLADVCGREAAAIAMGVYSRAFEEGEAQRVLEAEEGDWPKKLWKEGEGGVWTEEVVVDERVVGGMRRFCWEGEGEGEGRGRGEGEGER